MPGGERGYSDPSATGNRPARTGKCLVRGLLRRLPAADDAVQREHVPPWRQMRQRQAPDGFRRQHGSGRHHLRRFPRQQRRISAGDDKIRQVQFTPNVAQEGCLALAALDQLYGQFRRGNCQRQARQASAGANVGDPTTETPLWRQYLSKQGQQAQGVREVAICKAFQIATGNQVDALIPAPHQSDIAVELVLLTAREAGGTSSRIKLGCRPWRHIRARVSVLRMQRSASWPAPSESKGPPASSPARGPPGRGCPA